VGTKARDVAHAQQVMGIDWMTRWDDLADAIPPAYTQHIGEQLLAHLAAGTAA
jgi:DNA (cytosine-5)-methyltransferase 1